MVFTELLPGTPPPADPVVPSTLLKLSNNTRSYDMIDRLLEAGTDYGYLDDPDNRWIISLEQWKRGIGYMVVYKTDKNNIAEGNGHAPFSYADTCRTIIQRSMGYFIVNDPLLDLNPIISN